MTLLIGGARSGKSTIGQRPAAADDGPVTVIVTADSAFVDTGFVDTGFVDTGFVDTGFVDTGFVDREMAERILAHRSDRPESWTTIEAPIDLPRGLSDAGPTVLIDCVTLWLSNLVLGGADDNELRVAFDELAAVCVARAGTTIIIANEVGSGVVPMEALSRRFQMRTDG